MAARVRITSFRKRFGCMMLALAVLVVVSVGGAFAQSADPAPAEVSAQEDAEAAPPEDTAPAYPAGLDDPTLEIEELRLRLLPLTVDQLTELAAAWQGIVAGQTQAVVDESLALERLPTQEQEAARARVVALTETRNAGFDRFSEVVSNLARKGGDPATVETYRAYRSSIVVQEKQEADWGTLAEGALSWAVARDGGVQLAIRIAVIGGAIFALLLVARIVRGYARRMFRKLPNLSKLLQAFLATIVYWLTIAVGLMVVLSSLGVDITPLFALFGGGAFILAFAMQETLSNLAAGVMIMINRPFDEGDYVDVAGLGGTVKNVSIVSTQIVTPDNQIIVIPNSKVWGDVITNVTASDTRRVDMVFGIGYGDSIQEAQAVLEEVVSGHPLVLKDPAPVIRVNELADSAVNFIVRPWTKTTDYWAVYWDLQRAVKEAFDAKDISIPFPQTDMHLYMAPKSLPAAVDGLPLARQTSTGRGPGRDDPGPDDAAEPAPAAG